MNAEQSGGLGYGSDAAIRGVDDSGMKVWRVSHWITETYAGYSFN
jgi:hypothetical protein